MNFDFIRRRITELRLSRKMSEYQLSLHLRQCKSYIQGITSGKSLPSLKQLFNIYDFFDITPAQFFDDSSDVSPMYHETVNHLRALDDNELEAILKIVQQIEDLKEENRKVREGADGPRKYLLNLIEGDSF